MRGLEGEADVGGSGAVGRGEEEGVGRRMRDVRDNGMVRRDGKWRVLREREGERGGILYGVGEGGG